MDFTSRTKMLVGEKAINNFRNKNIIVFGIGGVGSYTIEALVRSGLNNITIVDKDIIDITNINRQIIANHKTIGEKKTEIMKKRIESINPKCNVKAIFKNLNKETINEFEFFQYDYIVDAIDTVSAKLLLIEIAKENDIPIISAMGAGNRLNPSLLKICDIFDTKNDPLSRIMRRELRKRNISSLKVVASEELPNKFDKSDKSSPASNAFVPSSAGLLIAADIFNYFIKKD